MATGRISAKTVAALEAGATLWDDALQGFGVRRQRGPIASYIVRFRVGGRSRQLTLGGADVLTPSEARERARRALLAVVDGRDPLAEREEAAAEQTVEQLVAAYFDAAAKGRVLTKTGKTRKPGSVEIDRRRVENHVVAKIGRLKAAAVTKRDIERLRDAIAETSGKGSSTRVIFALSGVFSWAVEQELVPINPCSRIRTHAYEPRTRRIQDEEYGAIGRVLASDTEGLWPGSVAAVRFLILTGWRLSEVANLQRAELDRAGRRVVLSDSKTGRSERVLSDEAWRIIDAQPASADGFVFAQGGGAAPAALQRTFRAVCARAGVRGLSPHTCRHGYISVAGDLLIAREAVKALVGHADNSVTGSYTHYANAALREVASRIAESIVQRMTSAPCEVVPLRAVLA